MSRVPYGSSVDVQVTGDLDVGQFDTATIDLVFLSDAKA